MLILGWSRALGVVHSTLWAGHTFTMAPAEKMRAIAKRGEGIPFQRAKGFCLQATCNSSVWRMKAELNTREGS